MAALYPSEQWIKDLQGVCNTDNEFKEYCGNFAGKFMFQIEAEAGKLEKPAYLFMSVDKGEVKEAQALSSAGERSDVEYVITGKYSVWKNVVQGKQEPLRALMTKKLQLIKGSQFTILKQAKFAFRMINNATKVPAVYADEIS
jgi:putative sterol carrier protein